MQNNNLFAQNETRVIIFYNIIVVKNIVDKKESSKNVFYTKRT